jgi:hypothetical protein
VISGRLTKGAPEFHSNSAQRTVSDKCHDSVEFGSIKGEIEAHDLNTTEENGLRSVQLRSDIETERAMPDGLNTDE